MFLSQGHLPRTRSHFLLEAPILLQGSPLGRNKAVRALPRLAMPGAGVSLVSSGGVKAAAGRIYMAELSWSLHRNGKGGAHDAFWGSVRGLGEPWGF